MTDLIERKAMFDGGTCVVSSLKYNEPLGATIEDDTTAEESQVFEASI